MTPDKAGKGSESVKMSDRLPSESSSLASTVLVEDGSDNGTLLVDTNRLVVTSSGQTAPYYGLISPTTFSNDGSIVVSSPSNVYSMSTIAPTTSTSSQPLISSISGHDNGSSYSLSHDTRRHSQSSFHVNYYSTIGETIGDKSMSESGRGEKELFKREKELFKREKELEDNGTKDLFSNIEII